MKKLIPVLLIGLILLQVQLLVAQNLSVAVTSPTKMERFNMCTDIILKADVTIVSGEVNRVYFYQNNSPVGAGVKTAPYQTTWKNVPNGIYVITAKVTDKLGNSYWSSPVTIFVDPIDDGDLIRNGEFNCSIVPWVLGLNQGGAATLTLEEAGWLSDTTSAKIEVTNPGTADWHVQLSQLVPIVNGHTYEISFMADAAAAKLISFELQENKDPWTIYWSASEEITSANAFGPYTYECTIDDPQAALRFNIGNNTTTIYIDAVKVIDKNWEPSNVAAGSIVPQGGLSYRLGQNYPNPFNLSTNIPYQLLNPAHLTLAIFNLQGQLVRTLVNSDQAKGNYLVQWDGKDVSNSIAPSGVYFYTLKVQSNNQTEVVTKKTILMK
jgi:hypothetical protein